MSDVDVSVLRILAPHETRVVFWDSFPEADFDFSDYIAAHGDDSRLSYRETTKMLRPLDGRNASAVLELGNLVHRRLMDTTPLTLVRRTGNLRFRFELGGIPRTLKFMLNGVVEGLSSARRYVADPRYGSRVSTIVALGSSISEAAFFWELLRLASHSCLTAAFQWHASFYRRELPRQPRRGYVTSCQIALLTRST